MKKLFLAGAVCIIALTSMIAEKRSNNKTSTDSSAGTHVIADNYVLAQNWIDSLYTSMHLQDVGLSKPVFFAACKGYEYMIAQNTLSKEGILTVCDYSQRSNKKRLYVLDLNNRKILFNTYVSHGRNSGDDYATSFSNSNDSHKTSLGFMRTAETYNGEHGYSMRLDGMEKGFNNNVRTRAIVMHGSDYVNANRVSSGTMMGRSFGCPAVPAKEVKKIINCIKGGSCFFSYYPDQYYTTASKILNADFVWPIAETLQLAQAKTPDTLARIIAEGDAVN